MMNAAASSKGHVPLYEYDRPYTARVSGGAITSQSNSVARSGGHMAGFPHFIGQMLNNSFENLLHSLQQPHIAPGVLARQPHTRPACVGLELKPEDLEQAEADAGSSLMQNPEPGTDYSQFRSGRQNLKFQTQINKISMRQGVI